MRLFKCWNSDITVNHDIMVMFAEDEEDAKNQIAEARSKDECFRDWLLYDTCLDEVVNDLQGNCDVFEHLADGNIDGFAKAVYRAIDLKNWSIEEYFVGNGEVFACYESFLDDENSCQVVSVPDNVFYYKDYIYGVLAERLAEEEHFRNFISDAAVNMTFAEQFWHDEKGYVFEEYELDIRGDIYRKFNWDISKANDYIENCFVKNVKEFFQDEPQYTEIFLEHVKNYDPNVEPDFSEEFYIYCAKKLIEEGKYTSYQIEQVTVI
ncbi:hypothetical protein [Schinkia azotoformans]|uniref:hypothetical protein n=1 Tax=Schinkia azotoformans TaxID=1454 RepID=UPI002DBD2D44|nr:hypothetical protein [Schinkia azotoformans]MEC1768301.1 hypothetical protein [Schinkia azotoformans]